MISSDDALVVAADPALPALKVVLDDDHAAQVIEHHYPHLQGAAVRCTYLRYKPGTSCLAAFALELPRGNTTVYAKAYPADQNAKLAKAAVLSRQELSGLPGRVVIEDLGLILIPFPLDDELPLLQRIAARDGRESLLRRLIGQRPGLADADLNLLSYKPERRFVARLDLRGKPCGVLKIHAQAEFEPINRATKRLHSIQAICAPQTLGYSNRHRAVLLSWLAGESLTSLLSNPSQAVEALALVGATLAKLHGERVTKIPLRSRQEDSAEIDNLRNTFSFLTAELSDTRNRQVQQCSQAICDLSDKLVTTHGDFHLKQSILQQNSAALIDLDSLALGNASYDVGNFLAHLDRELIVGNFTAEQHDLYCESFLRSYVEARGELTPSELRVYRVAGLLKLAQEPFRLRLSHWLLRTSQIMERCEELLRRVPNIPPPLRGNCRTQRDCEVEVIDTFHAAADASLPYVAESTEASRAGELLLEIVEKAYPEEIVRLRKIQVLRHKPGRRCVIAYEFVGPTPSPSHVLIGKIQAKSRHERCLKLQEKLRESGFGDDSEDEIFVPKPHGMVPQWHMWLQEFVSGKEGWQVLTGTSGVYWAARIAQAIHKLHRSEILTSRVHLIEDEIQLLEDKLLLVTEQFPEFKERISRLLEEYRCLSATASQAITCGIHRDFYPDQIKISGDRIYLLDLDLYCQGDPSLDVGNCAAHLIEYALRKPHLAGALNKARLSFISRYKALASPEECANLDIYVQLSLARHIYLSTQFSDRTATTTRLLDLCEQQFALRSTC